MITKKSLSDTLAQWVSNANTEKEKFIRDLNQDPLHALQWSQSLFKEVAMANVAKQLIRLINSDSWSKFSETEGMNMLRDHVNTCALRLARYPAFSTSVTDNLINTFETKAWAEAADLLK